MNRNGEISEALLFDRSVDWIWEKPVVEIMSFLDEGQQGRFIEDLKALSRPGWIDFRDGWKPPEDLLARIQEYFAKK